MVGRGVKGCLPSGDSNEDEPEGEGDMEEADEEDDETGEGEEDCVRPCAGSLSL